MSKHEHTPLNEAMRQAFTAGRFTVDAKGRLLRGPDEDAETGTDASAASRLPLGKSDAGASGDLPTDPVAAINAVIRRAMRGGGS